MLTSLVPFDGQQDGHGSSGCLRLYQREERYHVEGYFLSFKSKFYTSECKRIQDSVEDGPNGLQNGKDQKSMNGSNHVIE